MKHAYLIMCHNQWELLQELLKELDDPRNDIYLHIDKKQLCVPVDDISSCIKYSDVYFTKRHNIVWGGTQIMKCSISMLEEAMRIGYSYYHLISGVDFPLKSQDEIHMFFKKNDNLQYVSFDWDGIKDNRFVSRVQYFHFFKDIIGKGDNKMCVHRVLAKLESLSLALQKKLHVNRLNYIMYKGANWFSITHLTTEAIIENKRMFFKKYKFTANCDEIWLQTFLMQSEFREQLAGTNMRYIKWKQGNPSPEILTLGDYEDMVRSNCLFARKFDWNTNRDVILKLKDHLKSKQPPSQ